MTSLCHARPWRALCVCAPAPSRSAARSPRTITPVYPPLHPLLHGCNAPAATSAEPRCLHAAAQNSGAQRATKAPCIALQVWDRNSEQLVGWFPRLDAVSRTGRPRYLGKLGTLLWRGRYSIVLTKGAIMHAKYLRTYSEEMPSAVRRLVAERRNCEDIAMQFVVSNATHTAPTTVWAACAAMLLPVCAQLALPCTALRFSALLAAPPAHICALHCLRCSVRAFFLIT